MNDVGVDQYQVDFIYMLLVGGNTATINTSLTDNKLVGSAVEKATCPWSSRVEVF